MTERERLIEILKQQNCPNPMLCDEGCKYAHLESCYEARTADLLLTNGVIVPPVEIGQTVWFISPVSYKPKITETVIEKVVRKSGGVYIKLGCNAMYETSCKSIGKTVFLSREDAEKALKERSEGE
jgi:hypothetical protein